MNGGKNRRPPAIRIMFGPKTVLVAIGVLSRINFAGSDEGDQSDDPEQRLLDFLFTNSSYNKYVRPGIITNGAKHPLNVTVNFTVNRLLDLDEQLETMSLLLYIKESWHDERLKWNPQDFGGKKTLRLSPDSLWTPLTHIPNLEIFGRDGKAEQFNVQVSIKNGKAPTEVTMVTYAFLQERCEFDITYFPFDTQTCRMCLQATQYGLDELVYIAQDSLSQTFLDGGEWDLDDVISSTDSNGMFNASMACIKVAAQRRSLYYVINLFLPTVTICLLNTLSLFASIDADQNELDFAALGQTTLLSLGVLLLTVADQTPKGAGEVSLFGCFFLAMIFQTLLAAIIALYLKKWYRSQNNRSPIAAFLPKSAAPANKKSSAIKYMRHHAVKICMGLNLGLILFSTVVALAVGYSNKRNIFV